MATHPLVSGIIIFLNAETYLEEAIESILAQTYPNWELLLVDDGSTDRSTQIAQIYAQKYPDKIRYLEHESHQNLGMSATRNLGIREAKGKYVALLDADDVWLSQKLEKQVMLLENNPDIGIVFGPTQYWFSWTGKPEDNNRDILREIGVKPDKVYTPPTLLIKMLKNEANAPATCSILMLRSLMVELGGFEDSFRSLFEDRAFFTKVYLKIPALVVTEHYDRYRQHLDSACYVEQRSGKYKPTKYSEPHFQYLKWVETYLKEQHIDDPQVWQALKIGLLPYQNVTLHYLYRIQRYIKASLLKIINLLTHYIDQVFTIKS
ncbi:glycosyltransferase family A protein [Trichothermofontia sp.]